MTKAKKAMGKFELVFWGGAMMPQKRLPYRRYHETFEAAKGEAERMFEKLSRAKHPAIVYGPGCGRDGVTIS